MKHLIDKKKFLAEIEEYYLFDDGEYGLNRTEFKKVFSKHTKAMVDEPHHPSGKDRDKINIRNEHNEELRNG